MKFTFLSRLMAVLAVALLFTSCIDDDNRSYYQPIENSAFGYVVNASPSSGDLYFFADQNQLNREALNYGGSMGYFRFYLGDRTFTLKNSLGTTLATTTLKLENQDYFALFAVNTFNNIELVTYRDSLVSPAQGNARVRFINLSPDAPSLDVATTTSTLATGLDFKEASEFADVPAGSYDLTFKNTATGETVYTQTAEPLTAGNIYTIYVKGFVTPPTGSNDTFSAVKLTNYRG
nr:DUF4397 domain-containing protein [uncultured Flavobacterium sp.]